MVKAPVEGTHTERVCWCTGGLIVSRFVYHVFSIFGRDSSHVCTVFMSFEPQDYKRICIQHARVAFWSALHLS